MNYLNLEVAILHAPEYIGSSPRQRATWLNVMLWCVQQENAGVIQDGADWPSRRWQQTCGVTAREVLSAPDLLTVSEKNVLVWGYPIEKEREVQSKRTTARLNGLSGGRPPKPKPTLEPTLEPTSESVMEEEGKGREERESAAQPGTLSHFQPLALSDDQSADIVTRLEISTAGVSEAIKTFNAIKSNYPADARDADAFRGWLLTSTIGKGIRAKHRAKSNPVSMTTGPDGWRDALNTVRPGNVYSGNFAGLPADLRAEITTELEAARR